MAIKRLMRSAEIAESPFRSLQEVEKYLDRVGEQLEDETNLLKQYQRQFSRAQKARLESAAGFTFKVNTGDNDPYAGKGSSPKIDVTKVSKIVVPDMKSLRNNFTLVTSLTEHVDTLNTMLAQMSVTFRGVRGADTTLKNIQTMKRNAETQLKNALDFLSEVGREHAPKAFTELMQEICGDLSNELKFTKYTVSVYCTEPKPDDLLFTAYVKLDGLIDDENDQYPEFYVVFSAHLSPTTGSGVINQTTKQVERRSVHKELNMEYFITVMHQFEPPGSFHVGKKFTNARDGLDKLGTLLALESISNTLGNLPHGLSPDDIKVENLRVGDMVASIEVGDDNIMFWFKHNINQEEAKKATNHLYMDLRNMLQKGKIKKANLKARSRQDGRRYGVNFTLNMPAKEEQIDIHAVNFLREQFGLDDAKLKKVINILNQ